MYNLHDILQNIIETVVQSTFSAHFHLEKKQKIQNIHSPNCYFFNILLPFFQLIIREILTVSTRSMLSQLPPNTITSESLPALAVCHNLRHEGGNTPSEFKLKKVCVDL